MMLYCVWFSIRIDSDLSKGGKDNCANFDSACYVKDVPPIWNSNSNNKNQMASYN